MSHCGLAHLVPFDNRHVCSFSICDQLNQVLLKCFGRHCERRFIKILKAKREGFHPSAEIQKEKWKANKAKQSSASGLISTPSHGKTAAKLQSITESMVSIV